MITEGRETRRVNLETYTPESAIDWMLNQHMILKKSTKDPETFATVNGYVLSDEFREKIGSHLVELFAKSTRKKSLMEITVRDAFLTATIGATMEIVRVRLSEEKMTSCANIIMALLPIERLELEGIAEKPLRTLARDRLLVSRIRHAIA